MRAARQRRQPVAAQAGIEVVATGGIGRVHRNAVDTFDDSADLVELAARLAVALTRHKPI